MALMTLSKQFDVLSKKYKCHKIRKKQKSAVFYCKKIESIYG